MLGKLIKYEFKATGRIFLPMFAALLIVAAFNRLFISLNFAIPSIIGTTISVILIIGVFVLTLIITIQRFYKNLLSSEGYLMFTLPVKSDSLIWSKLIVATIWSIASVIIVVLAISIMAITGIDIRDIINGFSELIIHLQLGSANLILYGIEFITLIVLSLFSGILMLYACMALSLLVNKHRGLCAFGVFIIFNIITQVISVLAIIIGIELELDNLFQSLSIVQMAHVVLIASNIISLVSSAVCYILTRLMLTRKLNLE